MTEHEQPAAGTAVPPVQPAGRATPSGPATGPFGVPAGAPPLTGGPAADSAGPGPGDGPARPAGLSASPGGFADSGTSQASRAGDGAQRQAAGPGTGGAEQARPGGRPQTGSARAPGKRGAAEKGARSSTSRAVPDPAPGADSGPQPSHAPQEARQAPSPPTTAESGAVSHPSTGEMTAAGIPPATPTKPGGGAPDDGDAAERERRGGDRLRFVGAATRRIARGMDLDETVLGLCRASVPAYSDAILVYLRDPLPVGDERPTGPLMLRLRRSDRIPDDPAAMVAAASATGDRAQRDGGDGPSGGGPSLSAVSDGTAGAAEYVEVLNGGPLAEVLRGVRPVFADAPAARDALPELLGTDPDVPSGHRAILAPLRGRRRVIGAAVFLRRPERPAFEPDDLLIAAQLATHTALGVDKAVLYGREAYIADELQRTMLPDELPQPTGCHLASRYLPAAETARVGGDWYDAIPLPGSRVALVVGDVMGHSMTSAAIMGQLRTTAQTLAGLDLPPQEVLHHLDEQAQRLGSDRMATCLYAVYDPVAHRIIIANAGHPPPVLLHRDGRAEVLRIPAGAPIGVGGVDFEAVELDAPAGATLLLYTDGLVESRQRDVWTGIEHLREKLTATARLTRPDASAPLEPLCDEVLDILGPGDRDDDIALLAARFDGIAPSDVAYWFLDPRAQTAGQARRLARRALARWGLEELSDSVELLVSEVVTNAVRYAERPITLRLLRTDTLRCEVGDDVPQLPRLRQARATDEGGRGLYLVNRLARRWGATRLSTGKVVWFELPVN
ncbi:hypothetical protein GCM10012287_34920 [Streptomyces daqingensis]|uniref:PPM-type phosphatase domain-containing protein n=1 Tax=Streptomyces daqingensis TaxID=1472640 RepID=A0ABQ2MG28_9ACTN|nr:hypothetical protein GCM10012287_34920 [Streptomyces daqingensis]